MATPLGGVDSVEFGGNKFQVGESCSYSLNPWTKTPVQGANGKVGSIRMRRNQFVEFEMVVTEETVDTIRGMDGVRGACTLTFTSGLRFVINDAELEGDLDGDAFSGKVGTVRISGPTADGPL